MRSFSGVGTRGRRGRSWTTVPVVVGYQTTSALGMPVGIHLRAGWTVVPGSCALLF